MTATPLAVSNRAQWLRLLLGLFGVYALFEWSARALGSDRGQAGLLVAALVVGATIGVECLWTRRPAPAAMRALGLGRPSRDGLALAVLLCGLLWLVIPLFARRTGSIVTIQADALALAPGLFAQSGIAEETLFRGFLFRHLRVGRTFWRAAVLSMLPFMAAHVMLFFTLPLELAAAALALSLAISFPLAHLFELGGGTIWAPALLHFATQATVKVLGVTGPAASTFPFVWIAATALVPLLAFLVPAGRRPGRAFIAR